MNLFDVVTNCYYKRLTVIDGHNVLFNGKLSNFTYNCDADMVPYRDGLLKRNVEGQNVNGETLFIFLREE